MVRALVRLRAARAPALSWELIMDTVSEASVAAAPAHSDSRSDRRHVDDWINEGGHVTDLAGPESMSQQEALREMVRLVGKTLLTDFTNGFVGEHHNTFQHRSRVLRQLSNRLLAQTG